MNTRSVFNKKERELPAVSQPFSLEAERSIIGALLYDPAIILEELSDLILEDHFYDPLCRGVYKKALSMTQSCETIEIVLLAARLEGSLPGISEKEIRQRLEDIYTAYPGRQNLQGWCTVLKERWLERNLADMGSRLTQMAHVQDMPMEQKIASAHLMLSQVGTVMCKSTVVSNQEMVMETLVEVEANTKMGGQVSGIPTGFEEIDSLTTGFKPGDLIILAARPSMGKTSLALSLGKHVCYELPIEKRQRVLLFSMEMGKTQIGMRWLSVLYDVPLHNLRSGSLSPAQYSRLAVAADESTDSLFDLDESGTLTVQEIAATSRRVAREHGLGMIMVDYLQLISMGVGNKNSNKSDLVGDISRALKQLAKELKVPVIALSQLSRNLESRQEKRPIMSDLRDSGAIEQDADIIMFLYRDWVYNKNTQNPNEAEVIFAKHRNGETGTVKIQFEPTTTRFHTGAKRLGMGKSC